MVTSKAHETSVPNLLGCLLRRVLEDGRQVRRTNPELWSIQTVRCPASCYFNAGESPEY